MLVRAWCRERGRLVGHRQVVTTLSLLRRRTAVDCHRRGCRSFPGWTSTNLREDSEPTSQAEDQRANLIGPLVRSQSAVVSTTGLTPKRFQPSTCLFLMRPTPSHALNAQVDSFASNRSLRRPQGAGQVESGSSAANARQ